jgi:hypothetical protein
MARRRVDADANRRTRGRWTARGVVQRAEAWLGDELLMVEEMLDVVFDEPLDPSLFA